MITRVSLDMAGMTLEVDRYSVTLSYPGMGSDQRSWGTGAQPCGSSSAYSGPSASPTEIPQVPRLGGDPHRNPTDETALCGTVVTVVKSTDNPVDQPLRA
jgi:hypothetical protein